MFWFRSVTSYPLCNHSPGWELFALVTCKLTGYNAFMIKSFRHKGIQDFFQTGSKAGIQPSQAPRLRVQLTRLEAATSPQDMNAPGWKLHQLSGKLSGFWAVTVNGNWRLT